MPRTEDETDLVQEKLGQVYALFQEIVGPVGFPDEGGLTFADAMEFFSEIQCHAISAQTEIHTAVTTLLISQTHNLAHELFDDEDDSAEVDLVCPLHGANGRPGNIHGWTDGPLNFTCDGRGNVEAEEL